MKSLLLAIAVVFTPFLANGATYYVAKTGSNNFSCANAQSESMPRLTIAAGSACLSSGDTLMIQNGTYAEHLDYNQIPSGKSDSARTTIKAVNRLGVTLRPTTGTPTSETGHVIWVYGKSYITFDGLVVDAGGIVSPMSTSHAMFINNKSHHIRILNSELTNAISNCLGVQGASDSVEVINNKIHDCGVSNQHHGVYLRGSNNLVEGNEIYNNYGHGVHQWSSHESSNNTIVRYNDIHDNGSVGILIGSGADNVAHDNIVRNNGMRTRGTGITVGFYNTNNNQVDNNKIYSNRGDCIFIRRGTKNSKINNNICWRNGNDAIANYGIGSIITGNRVTDPSFGANGSGTSVSAK
jgi:parallel beta-helix repeat protein